MLDSDIDRLEDLRFHADALLGLLKGKSLAQFEADRTLQWAVERLLEIIGEAAGALSQEARDDIPHDWAGLRSMRNVIAHQYGRIQPRLVHAACKASIPTLREAIAPHLVQD